MKSVKAVEAIGRKHLLNLAMNSRSMAETAEKVYEGLEGYSVLQAYKAREVIKLYSRAFYNLQLLIVKGFKSLADVDSYLARLAPYARGVVSTVHHFECTMARGEVAQKRCEAAQEAIRALKAGIGFCEQEYEKAFGVRLE